MTFDGKIEQGDYARLLGTFDLEGVLYAVLLSLLAVVTIFSLGGVVVGLLLKGWNSVVIPVIFISILTGGGAILVFYLRRPGRRARRALQRFPDLLSLASGKVTKFGLVLDDGTIRHWFGPSQLSRSTVSPKGIRVRIDNDARRFLALTDRLFDGYSDAVAEKIVSHWRASTPRTSNDEQNIDLHLWNQLSDRPERAIAFGGLIAVQQSLRSPPMRQIATSETIAMGTSLTMAAFGASWLPAWIRWSFLAYAVYGIFRSAFLWWQYFFGVKSISWDQSGWISDDEIAIRREATGMRVRLDKISKTIVDASSVTMICPGGTICYLHRQQFESDDDWKNTLLTIEAIDSHTMSKPG